MEANTTAINAVADEPNGKETTNVVAGAFQIILLRALKDDFVTKGTNLNF